MEANRTLVLLAFHRQSPRKHRKMVLPYDWRDFRNAPILRLPLEFIVNSFHVVCIVCLKGLTSSLDRCVRYCFQSQCCKGTSIFMQEASGKAREACKETTAFLAAANGSSQALYARLKSLSPQLLSMQSQGG